MVHWPPGAREEFGRRVDAMLADDAFVMRCVDTHAMLGRPSAMKVALHAAARAGVVVAAKLLPAKAK